MIASNALKLTEGPKSISLASIQTERLFGQPSPFAIIYKVTKAFATLSKLD
jgi:hypothetical protein